MSQAIITETQLTEFPLVGRGKVRDLYDLGEYLLIVTTDRLSDRESIPSERSLIKCNFASSSPAILDTSSSAVPGSSSYLADINCAARNPPTWPELRAAPPGL